MIVNNAEVESEEFGGSNGQIAKRKRTKRRRMGAVSTEDHRINYEEEEEEDMANCLILLARSGGSCGDDEAIFGESPKKNNMGTFSSATNSNELVYECKTYDKAFQSFQALGGHRASYHTTKPASISNKPSSPPAHSTSKLHQCSICGSAFSSGQALGGHMRRHRTTTALADDNQMAAVAAAELQPQKVLGLLVGRYIRNGDHNNSFLASLDLNLLAPAEEDQDVHEMSHIRRMSAPTGQNSTNPSTTAPPLVGCYL